MYTYDEFLEIQRNIERNILPAMPDKTFDGAGGYNQRAIHLLCILKALDQAKPFGNENKVFLERVLKRVKDKSEDGLFYAFIGGFMIHPVTAFGPALFVSYSLQASGLTINFLPIYLGLLALTLGICGALEFKYKINLESKAESLTQVYFRNLGNPEPLDDKAESLTQGFFGKRKGQGARPEAEVEVELAVIPAPIQV